MAIKGAVALITGAGSRWSCHVVRRSPALAVRRVAQEEALNTTMTLADLETTFMQVSGERTLHSDQPLGLAACAQALEAARAGNYGVGALLVNPAGEIVAQGQNAVFSPYFRSDLHAEMVAMNTFEDQNRSAENMRGYTLFSSLEPCPMCMARLLVAGVQTVKFLAYDQLAGMVNQRHQFPIAWQRLWQRQEFVQADVSAALRRFALDVFSLNLETCRQRLLKR